MRPLPALATLLTLAAAGPPADAQTAPTGPGLARPLVGLGTAVALDGDVIVVGRPGAFPSFKVPPGEAGGVHVFTRRDGAWTETGTMRAALPPGSGFGSAVAVRGRTALVGAPDADGGTGAAYVFERTWAGWREVARLVPAGAAAGDGIGAAVALRDDLALVGAPGHGGAGAVFVFAHRDGRWRELRTLTAPDAPADANFGRTLALEANRAVVGAPGPQAGFIDVAFLGAPTYHPGTVHVFDRAGDAWTHRATLTAGDSTVRTLGAAVALRGDEVYAGAPNAGGRGTVIRFVRGPDGWRETDAIRPDQLANAGAYGAALALAGDDLLVGAPGAGAGRIFVFRRGDAWAVAQTLTVEPRGPMVRFGDVLAAAGDLAVAGAPGDDYFEGTAFVLHRGEQGAWSVAARAVERGDRAAALTGRQRDCTEGTAGPFDCSDVDLLSYLPSSALGAGRGIWISDTWGWTDPATGAEIAIVGRIDGTAFVDVSDPVNPVYLGELPLTPGARPNLWRDMKVYGHHAFIVADNAGPHGMQVFDLNRLLTVDAPPVTFTADTVYTGIHSAHNLAINPETGFAYTVGNSGGGETCGGHLHMVDVRTPTRPVFAGCYVIPNSPGTHDLQCVTYRGPDADYQGREICFNSSATMLDIADVTDKQHPVRVASATYPSLAYSHQGWLSEDHRYFYLNDELDEVAGGAARTRTLIFDVAQLDDPVLVEQYLGETAATDHNLYVRGTYVYESNYVAGLRILDVSNPVKPVEVGFFDTVPGGPNVPGFAGSWSNYPFFASGIIVVTSIREGLFILKKRDAPLVP